MTSCLILAAGQGTRLRPFTNDCPKGLVELLGKPLVCHQISTLSASGINDIAIATGYKSEKFDTIGFQLSIIVFLTKLIWSKAFCRSSFY